VIFIPQCSGAAEAGELSASVRANPESAATTGVRRARRRERMLDPNRDHLPEQRVGASGLLIA